MDIPPGGEGKIEVTFDSGHKKGKQKKTITVESNDPVNPKSTLHVTALIEIEFGFEAHSLNMGRIPRGASTSKTTVLLLKDFKKKNLLDVTSQSPNIIVETVNTTPDNESRIEIEVTVKPETSPGKLNEMITARLSDDSYPAVNLRITGTVIGNVEVTPEIVRFNVDSAGKVTDQAEQKIRVFSTQDEAVLRLLSVEDSKDLLIIEVDTVVSDKHYEIKARPGDNALTLGHNTSGEIIILTNDTEQPELRVRYSIVFPRR